MSVDKPIFSLNGNKKKNIQGIPQNGSDPSSLGKYVLEGPKKAIGFETTCNQTTELNFTGPPGKASSIYYSLIFQLPKWNFFLSKIDEWIEVSPTHQEYYQRTVATKKNLEGIIKEGLASASSAVADYELLKHDMRKYEEMIKYLNEKDEHSLKAMFIDQVDVHTGETVAMKSIAPRWPTIIADFMKLEDKDDKVDDIAKKLNISKAEAVILTTKNKLYNSWKGTFLTVVRDRYHLLYGLVKAREISINEYKTWLKPYIMRFKMTVLGGERENIRASTMKAMADITGQSTFANGIHLFAWKVIKTSDIRKPLKEMGSEGFVTEPYDYYVRDNFILNRKTGLAEIYPWLAETVKYCMNCKKYIKLEPGQKTCPKCKWEGKIVDKTLADKIVEEEILPAWSKCEMNLDPTESYYMFYDIDVSRVGSRLAVGEIEDITFTINGYTMSHNILLVKILEMKCREREIERYIDEILGFKIGESDALAIAREKYPEAFEVKKEEETELQKFMREFSKIGEEFSGFFGGIKMPKTDLMFAKPGPYESHFKDRVTKYYMKKTGENFAEIIGFIKEKMGV